jgi:hypothetical protein
MKLSRLARESLGFRALDDITHAGMETCILVGSEWAAFVASRTSMGENSQSIHLQLKDGI